MDIKQFAELENNFMPGHNSCAGCGFPAIVRTIMKATGKDTVACLATGCLEVTSTLWPRSAWKVPCIHNTFENAAATISGVEAAYKALKKKGKVRKQMKFVAFAGDGGCYSEDTEIFTERGFIPIKNMKLGENIWSVHPKTNELELTHIVKIFKYKVDGKMVRVRSRYIDFLVTPDHNVPIKLKNGYKFITANDLFARYKTPFNRSFKWKGKRLNYYKIPKTKGRKPINNFSKFKIEDWLQFLGWFITEGTLYKSKSGYLIRIYQSNKKNRKEILNLLKRMNLPAFECNRSVDFQSKQIYELLLNDCGKYSKERKIPNWVLDLDRSLLKYIYESLMKGDGSVKKQKNRRIPHSKFITSSQKLMNNFVELVLKLGCNCNVSFDKRKIYRIGISKQHLEHYIYTKRNLYEKQGIKQVKEERYKGMVYCPQLYKNHTVIIKRNNKISLNGNSYDIGLQSLSGMLERGHDVVYVLYDNEGYMNCLSRDSLVMTQAGLKKITDIKKGEKIYAFDLKKHNPILKKCSGIFDNGIKKVYELKTYHHSIKATSNHPFLILKRKGRGKTPELVWKKLENLKKGDEIIVSKNNPFISKSFKFKPITISKKGDYKVNKINEIRLPKESSPNLMEILGLYVGDGWIREKKGEIGFALPKGTKASNRLIELYVKLFGKKLIHKEKNYIYVYSVNLARFINSLDFGTSAKTKIVPPWVFTLPKEEKEAFFRGLMLSDGYKIRNSNRYVSASQDLLKTLRLLLQTTNYRVGKIHLQKKLKGEFCVYRRLLEDSSYGYICFSKKKNPNIKKYLSQIKQRDFFIDNDYFSTEKINSITFIKEEPTLDLRVDGEHNFIADGIVVHNTGNQRSSATPFGAATTTTPDGKVLHGKDLFRKDITKIAVAHNIPYVAQSAMHTWSDLYEKAKKAFAVKGPAFLNVFSPCPQNWKYHSSLGVEISKLAVNSNFWPLYEVENGVWKLNYKPANPVPVEKFLKPQKRFSHLFEKGNEKMIPIIQDHIDEEWKKLNFLCKENFA